MSQKARIEALEKQLHLMTDIANILDVTGDYRREIAFAENVIDNPDYRYGVFEKWA